MEKDMRFYKIIIFCLVINISSLFLLDSMGLLSLNFNEGGNDHKILYCKDSIKGIYQTADFLKKVGTDTYYRNSR